MTNQTTEVEGDYLSPGEAAKIARVTPKTLGRMANDGLIRSRKLPSGHRRYNEQDVRSLLRPVEAPQTPTEASPHASVGSFPGDAA